MLTSAVPQCSVSRSFMLHSTHRFALLLALLISADFTTAAAAQEPVGELDAMGISAEKNAVPVRTSINVLSGSSIEAGMQIATLRLKRGGRVMLCPGTKLEITAAPDGRGLMFRLGRGNLEMDYPLESVADTLLTPNLRLLMSGPGVLHQAVAVSPNGDICVQSLPANTTWVVISETKGDATYQMPSGDEVVFQGGRISGALPAQQNCGCPSSPRKDIANTAVSVGAQPTQPSSKPQPVVANPQAPVDALSAPRARPTTRDLAATASSLPLRQDQPASVERRAQPGQAGTTLPSSNAPSGHGELAAPAAAADLGGSLTVQVGAFSVKDNAYRLADQLKGKHYPVEVFERTDSAHRLWYVVRVGRYANRALARAAAAKLASEDNLGLKPFICAM
jgi:septal ring-binding cell division protein DamX